MSILSRRGAHSYKGPTRSRQVVFGVVLSAALIGAAVLVFVSFSGALGTYVTIKADLPSTGSAVQLKGPVEYRDVTVGAVSGQGHPINDHTVEVTLRMKPGRLSVVPSNVVATVAPLSIFGNQYVRLSLPGGPPARPLRAGDTIAALPDAPSSSLQSTLTDLDGVLKAVQPAQLDAALTALATALKGQGSSLGATLDSASSYLAEMNPLLPTLEHDLQLITPVVNQLSASTPNILNIFSNLTVTSQTISNNSTQLKSLLVGAGETASEATQLLTVIQQPFVAFLVESQPLIADISQNPNELSQVLKGLDAWSKSWAVAESHGPYLSLSATLQIPNPADVVLSTFGGPGADKPFAIGVGLDKFNPATYTAADCPRYGTMVGANCAGGSSVGAAELTPVASSASVPAASPGAGGVAAASTTAQSGTAAPGGTPAAPVSAKANPVVGSAAQQQAVSAIFAGLNGGAPPAQPGVATLILGPLLGAMAGGG